MKLVEEAWNSYVQDVLPPGLPKASVQYKETKRAFYGGARSLLDSLLKVFGPGAEPTESDLLIMDGVDEELKRQSGPHPEDRETGIRSGYNSVVFGQRAFLGQVPLVLGPSSWGQGMVFPAPLPPPPAQGPYYGEWGVVDEETGEIVDSGRLGPYNTIDEAFDAAVQAATEAGAESLPSGGFAQVKDSMGRTVGPIT